MDLFDVEIERMIQGEVVPIVLQGRYADAMGWVPEIQERLYANIPDNKRISYGRYTTVKVLSQRLYEYLEDVDAPVFDFTIFMLDQDENYLTRGVALGTLSFYGLEQFEDVVPYFEAAAADKQWEVREFAAAFFRKLIKVYPDEVRALYLRLVQSDDPNLRRFVSESLRPVSDNRWFHKDPEYPLSILRRLFREPKPYPRSSVGNNLSDWSRRQPEMVYGIVAELVESGDKNSYWIAYRACRNLVKKEPLRVMDLLGVDEYKYKKRVHRRSDAVNRG